MKGDPHKVVVLGAGLIGAGWAALFALCGWRVVVVDPAKSASDRVVAMIEQARPVLERLGKTANITASVNVIAKADDNVKGAVLVQEALPERLELKQRVLTALEDLISPKTLIASSASGLVPTQLQTGLRHPGRLLIAHPCNPPWLMPVVELVGGRDTTPAALDQAEVIYRTLGKQPVRLCREVPGHLLNRLQAALWREAVYLVAEGYASVADVDTAVTQGLGARWACCGPHEVFHLAGAERGMDGFLDNLGDAVESWWRELGDPVLDASTRAALVVGMDQAVTGKSVTELAQRRDARMLRVLAALGAEC